MTVHQLYIAVNRSRWNAIIKCALQMSAWALLSLTALKICVYHVGAHRYGEDNAAESVSRIMTGSVLETYDRVCVRDL